MTNRNAFDDAIHRAHIRELGAATNRVARVFVSATLVSISIALAFVLAAYLF